VVEKDAFKVNGFLAILVLIALLAVALLAAGYGALLQNITSMAIITLVSDMAVLGKVYLALVGTGAVLGVLGTYISLNRFLNV